MLLSVHVGCCFGTSGMVIAPPPQVAVLNNNGERLVPGRGTRRPLLPSTRTQVCFPAATSQIFLSHLRTPLSACRKSVLLHLHNNLHSPSHSMQQQPCALRQDDSSEFSRSKKYRTWQRQPCIMHSGVTHSSTMHRSAMLCACNALPMHHTVKKTLL